MSLESLTIAAVAQIGDALLNGCTSLTSLTIPNSLREIGNQAFRGSISLTSLTIPDSVRDIGAEAFIACHGCRSLDTLTIQGAEIGEHAFCGCNTLTKLAIH